MTMVTVMEKTKIWYVRYLGHLMFLAGFSQERGKPDRQALAELRAAARGGVFEIRALRHIVPYLPEDDDYRKHHVQVGLIVGQLFATHPPDQATAGSKTESEKDSRGRSAGRLLGEAEAAVNRKGDASPGTDAGNRNPSALERHLQTVAAADFDQLGTRLRGTFARLKQAGITPSMADYRRLFDDLARWKSEKKSVQYRWISDFYHRRYRSNSDGENNTP